MKKITKKGDLPSIAFIMVMLVIFLIMFVVTWKVFSIGSDILGAEDGGGNLIIENAQPIKDELDSSITWLDGLLVVLIIGMMVTLLVTSFFVKSSPIFIPMAIMIGLVLYGMSWYISNVTTDIFENETTGFVTEGNAFPATKMVLNFLPLIIVLVVIINGLVLYGNRETG